MQFAVKSFNAGDLGFEVECESIRENTCCSYSSIQTASYGHGRIVYLVFHNGLFAWSEPRMSLEFHTENDAASFYAAVRAGVVHKRTA